MKTRKSISSAIVLTLVLLLIAPALVVNAALPADMSWVKDAGNPVVNSTLCYPGEHFRPAVVVESANNYKMYFSHRSDGADVYLATSSDGGHTWTCANSGNPVLTRGPSGAWDATRVMTVSILKDGSTYKMWYTGRDAAGIYAIGYADSADGMSWTKHPNPVLNKGDLGAWDSQYVREPSVVKTSGAYHLWYSGTDNWPRFNIGHATSPDGMTWTKDSAPALSGTPGEWDANEVYAPSVVMNGSVFEMFYSGENGERWLLGHASSPDGATWTKDTNAIISPSATGWDTCDSADYAGAVLDSSTWKVFYSSCGSDSSYKIGLATLMAQAQLTFNPLGTSLDVGGHTDVLIDLSAVTNLYGYQFQVNYDSTKVSATGAFVNSFFDTATPDRSFSTWHADCATPGVCKFAVTKQSPATPVSGSGTLARITFTGVAPGLVTLTFSNSLLSDRDAHAIVHSTTTGYLTVSGSATINGTIRLQGRATPVDAGSVTLKDRYGIFAPVTVPFDAGTGNFTASVPVESGGAMYLLSAVHSLYLDNQLGDSISGGGITVTPGGSATAAITTLKGGDANNDGSITISDLSCIGGAFGGAPTACGATGSSDINQDNTVNILDLVLPGGNYGLSSPQSW
ncbi:MAG TPA: cohesin domain-containing protein [Anaerolineae bacterium]|nr:cohesin domain-containing protein [Anaerolineae bacterium]